MKILLCDPVDPTVLEHFREREDATVLEVFERDQLLEAIPDAEFLVVRSGTTVDREILDAGTRLLGIVRAGVGLDNIDLEYADEQGVAVENTPEASTNAVAELVVGHVLSLYRSIPRADAALKQGDWIKSDLEGREIQGKTAGIIGYGRIGARVGRLLEGFGAEILGYDKFIDDATIRERGGSPTDFQDLLVRSDIVSIHVPLTDSTHHLIGEDELEILPDHALLVNCSRGGVYDETALNEALERGSIGGVGLDTYEKEPPGKTDLLRRPETVGTPHIGASTLEAQERIGQLVIEKIEAIAGAEE